ncbi:MAG: SRPBCC domain-containing protein [Chitinophagaceae bacterium]
MSTPLIVNSTITINAPAARVWDALTNPEQTKKYMFGCETVSDWKPGSSLLWKGVYQGNEMVFVKGTITAIEPNKYLEYTTIDPNSGIADVPENYLTVTYSLASGNGETVLTVTQGDYAKVGDGEKRYKETVDGGGWMPILVEIKKLIEEQ